MFLQGHKFRETYFTILTKCSLCASVLWGVTAPQGFRCELCKMVAHKGRFQKEF